MATSREMVYDALTMIQVRGAGEVPEAADLQDGLRFFNEFMFACTLEGIDVDWLTLGADDTVPLPNAHIQPFKYLLAVVFAPLFGRELDPAIATKAERFRSLLQMHYTDIPTATFDPALRSRLSNQYDQTQG